MSGIHGGALLQFDRLNGKATLHVYCRHHVGDLYQKKSYTICFSTTKAPVNADFKEFRKIFQSLQLDSVQPRLNEQFRHPLLVALREEMRKICTNVLLLKDTRSDKKQYAELCLHLNGFELPSKKVLLLLLLLLVLPICHSYNTILSYRQ